MKRIHRIVALALVIVLVLTVPAFADWSATDSSNLSTIRIKLDSFYSIFTNSSSSWASAFGYFKSISTNLATILGKFNSWGSWGGGSSSKDYTSILNTISQKLTALESSIDDTMSSTNLVATYALHTSNSFDTLLDYVGPEHYEHYSWFAEMLDETGNLTASFDNLLYTVRDIRDVIADEQDKAINDSFKDDKDAFRNGFGGSHRGSIGDMSGVSSGFKSWFSLPNVDITSLFDQVDTGFGGWFSQDTADALKAQYGTSSLDLDLDDGESDTPYYDENQREVQEILSGGDGEW